MVDSHLICSKRDLELEGKSGYWDIEGEDHRIHSHWYSIQQDSSSHIFLKGNGPKVRQNKSVCWNESNVRPNAWKSI